MKAWMNRFFGMVLVIGMAGVPELCAGMSGNENLPDSPGTLLAKQEAQNPSQADPSDQGAQPSPKQDSQNSTSQQNSGQQNGSQQNAPAANGAQQQNAPQQPVGGAAAQLGRTTGGAASKPAGAALAPAKQRQTRSLLLKVGVIAGAGIAVGSVAALAHASPSRPPGTH